MMTGTDDIPRQSLMSPRLNISPSPSRDAPTEDSFSVRQRQQNEFSLLPPAFQPLLLDASATLLPSNGNVKKARRRRKQPTSTPATTARHVKNRICHRQGLLLALMLSITLAVFWLVDSLKDPIFATLVDGNLKRHQPLAKMASVAGTLLLVLLLEFIHSSQQRAQHCDDPVLRTTDDVLDAGGTWTRMDIATAATTDTHQPAARSSTRIPIELFGIVGAFYILLFGTMSYILSFHPKICSNTADLRGTNSTAWHILAYFLYLTIESYGSISVATFWSFCNSTLTLKAAKHWYGFIIAIGQIGAILGSTIATVTDSSIPFLLGVVTCGGISLGIGTVYVYGRLFPYPTIPNDDDDDYKEDENEESDRHCGVDYEVKLMLQNAQQGRKCRKDLQPCKSTTATRSPSTAFLSGLFLIFRHNYLLLILGVSCLYEISLTCLDYEMKLLGLDRFSSQGNDADISVAGLLDKERTSMSFQHFMGRYGQLTNFLSLLLSYYAFPYLIKRWGLKRTLCIFPTLLLTVTIVTFLALPMNLPVLFLSISLLKAMTFSINDPAKEILYIPTSNIIKFKAKFWIDVVGARIAKAVGSSINTYAGSAERIVRYGALPSLSTAFGLWVVCYFAGFKFDRLLDTGEIVGLEDEEQWMELRDFTKEEHRCNYGHSDDDDDSTNCGNFIERTDGDVEWENNTIIELS